MGRVKPGNYLLSVYFAVRGRHNKVFPCDGGGRERGRERVQEVKDGEKGRVRELKMLSEDINASMNYSVMTTRSVIKNAANICSTFKRGAVRSGPATEERR